MPRKKKFYRKKKPSVPGPVVRKYVQQQLRKTDAAELKFYSTGSSPEFNTTGFCTQLATIPQGDGISAREGDSVMPTSLVVKGRIQRGSTATTSTFDAVRIMIVRWHPDSASTTLSSPNQLLQDFTSGVAVYSPLKLNRADRKDFDVLYDRRFVVPARDLVEAYRDIFIPIKLKKKIQFNAATTSGLGTLWIVGVGSYASSSVECADLVYQYVVRYRG